MGKDARESAVRTYLLRHVQKLPFHDVFLSVYRAHQIGTQELHSVARTANEANGIHICSVLTPQVNHVHGHVSNRIYI